MADKKSTGAKSKSKITPGQTTLDQLFRRRRDAETASSEAETAKPDTDESQLCASAPSIDCDAVQNHAEAAAADADAPEPLRPRRVRQARGAAPARHMELEVPNQPQANHADPQDAPLAGQIIDLTRSSPVKPDTEDSQPPTSSPSNDSHAVEHDQNQAELRADNGGASVPPRRTSRIRRARGIIPARHVEPEVPDEREGAEALADQIIDLTHSSPAPVEPYYQRPSPTPSSLNTSSGPSNEDPFIGDSSVSVTHNADRPTQKQPISIHPLFSLPKARSNETRAPVNQPLINSPGKNREKIPVPLPNKDSQHIRGPQSSFSAPPPPFWKIEDPGRVPPSPELSLADIRFLRQREDDVSTRACSVLDDVQNVEAAAIPLEHQRDHPAIAKVIAAAVSSPEPSPPVAVPPQKLWTDKWRPTRADEVLGNEHHARYLRDWLLTLELQFAPAPEPVPAEAATKKRGKGAARAKRLATSSKRPRVIRGVDRKSKRRRVHSDEEDDWIVPDHESEEDFDWPVVPENHGDGEDTEDDPDDIEFCRQAVAKSNAKSSRPDETMVERAVPRHDFGDRVTNAILLAGPPGCGKTAAVYACADELGWEVFEVNPGTGKRSGASLDNLVGEVGKNHLVRTGKQGSVKDGLLHASRVAKQGKLREQLESLALRGQDQEESAAAGPSKPSNSEFPAARDGVEVSSPRGNARQSLILLEEVDILFKGDVNFWPAVIGLIEQCRRPVVMTCNDLSLIPVHDLALQSIMNFEPCPTPVAASYLQAICLAERPFLNREFLVRLYESTFLVPCVDVPDAPLNPWVEDLALPDLRRTINQLQFAVFQDPELHESSCCRLTSEDLADCVPPVSLDGITVREGLQQISALLRHVENVSFADGHVLRLPMNSHEGNVLTSHEASHDDELGHRLLCDPLGSSSSRSHAYFGYYDTDEVIGRELLRCSQSLVANVGQMMKAATTALQTRALFRSRVAYQNKLVGALDVIPLSAPLLPRPAVFLDYVPWIRYMVEAEERSERPGGRGTANSQRRVGWLGIAEEDRVELCCTAFSL